MPQRYRPLFRGAGGLLNTHRGLDIGSAELGRSIARRLGVEFFEAPVTRLLVDCNRSPRHPQVFSEFTRRLPRSARRELMARYYSPYRDGVSAAVAERIAGGRSVLHVSVHSFTRWLDGAERNADIGLLYDPSREPERRLCVDWQSRLLDRADFRVRRNYPYRGTADGLVTSLRRRFPADLYGGVELEFCQDLAERGGRRWLALKEHLAGSLADLLRQTGRAT